MKLELLNGRPIREVRHDFNDTYPFLKLEFYKTNNHAQPVRVKEHLPHTMLLRSAGLKKEGDLEVNDEMTVGELERILRDQFGIVAQVSRNSGGIWLETTMTDKWSLRKQNDYGKEIVKHTKQDFTDYGQVDS